MRRDLPSGTVTFLFTDIEGSTKLLREVGPEDYARSLAEHRAALRRAFEAHRGVEVDTQGDAFFVAFADAADALEAAREAQERGTGPIRARMGVHTGDPLLTDEGYVGIDVHKAARICAAGHGGQILVSERTKALLEGAPVRPLGVHRLKDLTAPEPLYQLGEDEFPPIRSLNTSNLPEQPTPFTGRDRELGDVLNLLRRDDVRLLTLTGPGGSGKTRLGVQAAAESVDEHEHGVWWVGLQSVHDPDVVLPTIASTIGAAADLAEHIASKRMMLLLDNLEQLIGAAPAIGDLLSSCPNLTILVTSREPLRLAAEHEYAVPPLVESESVPFFLARAQRLRRDLDGGHEIREICGRLDHLPLALELAAARVKAMSPAQLLERLDQRLPLLTAGARDAPDRQKTLRSTIEWSHDLLSPDEQRLFRRLSVFVGGWSLDAAGSIAGADLDTVQSLVDKSLVRFDGERYAMLETIREYASEQLDRSGETDDVRRRHREFFRSLAEDAHLSAEMEYGRRHDLALPELDNLRAAIDRAADAGDVGFALAMAVSLENLWVTVDPFQGIRRFETLLDASGDDLPPLLRARALRCLSGSAEMAGEGERARNAIDASLALFRDVGDERDVAVLLHRKGINAINTGRPDLAREPLEEAMSIFERVGSKRGLAQSIGSLGYLARENGDLERAIELFEESREMVHESGFVWWEVGMLQAIADCTLRIGRLEETADRSRESLTLANSVTDRQSTVYGLAFLAGVAAERGDPETAGRLWGAIESEEERRPIGGWDAERGDYLAYVSKVAGPELDAALEEGRRLSLDEAVALALGASDAEGSGRR